MIPDNHGKPWLSEDEDLLLKKISNNETIKNISIYFKRTEGGIRSRLKDIACRFVEQGNTIEEASRYTKVPIELIEKSLKFRKYNKPPSQIDDLLKKINELEDRIKALEEDNDNELYSQLKTERNAIAKEQNMAAYMIFHNSTLKEISIKKPATLEQLKKIKGIGEKKLESYGPHILQIVKYYITE